LYAQYRLVLISVSVVSFICPTAYHQHYFFGITLSLSWHHWLSHCNEWVISGIVAAIQWTSYCFSVIPTQLQWHHLRILHRILCPYHVWCK